MKYTQEELKQEYQRRLDLENQRRLEELKLYDIIKYKDGTFYIPGVQE